MTAFFSSFNFIHNSIWCPWTYKCRQKHWFWCGCVSICTCLQPMLPNLCVLHNFWFPVILFVSIFVHINASAFFDVHLCEFVCFLYDKHCESTETQPSHLQAAYKWMLHFSNCFFIDKWLWSVLGHCLSVLLLFLIEFHPFFATLWFSESKTLMLLHTAPCVCLSILSPILCAHI